MMMNPFILTFQFSVGVSTEPSISLLWYEVVLFFTYVLVYQYLPQGLSGTARK
jgi:hypothetical protein